MRSMFFTVVLASSALVACGGASDSGLFGGPGSIDIDAGAIDSGSTGHGGNPDAGSSAPDATAGGDTGGGASDGGIDPLPDTGTAVDASPPVVDAAPPDTNPGVYCGDTNGNATYCKVGTACCVKSSSGLPGGGSGSACETSTVPFCSGVAVECDSDDDCKGQVCCGTLVANSRYTSVRCQATCDTQSDTQIHFCDPNAQDDVCAADGLQCTASGILPGYSVCN